MTSKQASSHTPSDHGVESLVVGAAAQLDSKLNMVAQQINDPRSVAGQNIANTALNAGALEQAARQQQLEAFRIDQNIRNPNLTPNMPPTSIARRLA